MARITVEDCVKVILNRFELCLIASNRAKNILSGAHTEFTDHEKPAVISLREIAEDKIDVESVRKNIVKNIKNRGMSEETYSEDRKEIKEAMAAEGEGGAAVASEEGSFVDENIEVDD